MRANGTRSTLTPAVAALVGAVCLSVTGIVTSGQTTARVVSAHGWAGKGVWMRADTHVHTRFSDGGNTIDEVAGRAERHGCDAIAITDHASRARFAASDAYLAEITAARAARPKLVIVAGLEWNVPPYDSREHVTVLVPESPSEGPTLAEFKRQFDDFERIDGTKPRAEDALVWLGQHGATPEAKPVVVYNHPSRKDATSLENVDDVTRWRGASDLVVGFEGGPGHQGRLPIGSYEGKILTIDRWDPAVAEPGNAWDVLLQRGVDLHGAGASADFHNDNPQSLNDYWPCAFVETWYYAPERTTAGLLRAMRAGTFFGVHGHIAREVELTASVDKLARPAVTGERLEVPAGTAVTVSLRATVPEVDWDAKPNHLDALEFIIVTPQAVTERSQAITGTGMRTITERIVIGTEDVVVRARGRRVVPDGPDLMFYTNAIRISVRK